MTDTIKNSILAKFQQLNELKEKAALEAESNPQDYSERNKTNLKSQINSKDGNRFVRAEKPSLSESEVGITEYVTPSTAFTGIIKHRFSDFQVHEIDLDGKIVIFDSTEIPKVAEEVSESKLDNYRSSLTSEQWDKLDSLMNSGDTKEKFSIDVSDLDKAQRTRIHKAVKAAYGAKVCSNSVKENDQTYIQVGIAGGNKERISWPACQGRFLHFTVYKENMDTAFLVDILSKSTRSRPNAITFAGTKDKRAKTTQRMCIRNKRAEQVLSTKTYNKVHFGNFSYQHSPLRLGNLSGNKFTLAIRNVSTGDDQINDILTSIRTKGFVNYYGLQRFGSSACMPTHCVGKLMLLEDWKETVNAILKPKGHSSSPGEEACETWQKTKNAALALKRLGRKTGSIEGRILSALKARENNFYDALFAIPRNSLLLYLHAYQSYIWNKVVSRRIREFGFVTLAGDLVIDDSYEVEQEKNGTKSSEMMDLDEKESGSDCEEEQSAVCELEPRLKKVRKLTESEAKKTEFSNVVYPLPGNDVEFPDNIVKQWYDEIMDEDGISMDHFVNCKKAFSLYGTYRKVVVRPDDMRWSIVKYENPEADLILSDLDRMCGKTLPVSDSKDAKYKAVILEFSVEPSVYATMLLREMTKSETSASFQAKLTEDFKRSADSNLSKTCDKEPPVKLCKTDDV